MNTREALQNDFDELGAIILNIISENKHVTLINDTYVQSSDDVIIIVDVKTNIITFMNEEAKRVFGHCVGNYYTDVINIDDPYNSREIGKLYRRVYYDEITDKMYIIQDIIKEVNNNLLLFEKAVNVNGERKEIVRITNKYNLNLDGK